MSFYDIDMDNNRIRINDQVYLNRHSNELVFVANSKISTLSMEPIMVRLITVLASQPNRLVSRQQLISLVWDGNDGVGNKALTKNVYKIRKAFEQNGLENPIKTIPKKGYILKIKLNESKKLLNRNRLALIGLAILGILAVKILVPGIFHFIFHRMSH